MKNCTEQMCCGCKAITCQTYDGECYESVRSNHSVLNYFLSICALKNLAFYQGMLEIQVNKIPMRKMFSKWIVLSQSKHFCSLHRMALCFKMHQKKILGRSSIGLTTSTVMERIIFFVQRMTPYIETEKMKLFEVKDCCFASSV